jgi:hypothetical protein
MEESVDKKKGGDHLTTDCSKTLVPSTTTVSMVNLEPPVDFERTAMVSNLNPIGPTTRNAKKKDLTKGASSLTSLPHPHLNVVNPPTKASAPQDWIGLQRGHEDFTAKDLEHPDVETNMSLIKQRALKLKTVPTKKKHPKKVHRRQNSDGQKNTTEFHANALLPVTFIDPDMSMAAPRALAMAAIAHDDAESPQRIESEAKSTLPMRRRRSMDPDASTAFLSRQSLDANLPEKCSLDPEASCVFLEQSYDNGILVTTDSVLTKQTTSDILMTATTMMYSGSCSGPEFSLVTSSSHATNPSPTSVAFTTPSVQDPLMRQNDGARPRSSWKCRTASPVEARIPDKSRKTKSLMTHGLSYRSKTGHHDSEPTHFLTRPLPTPRAPSQEVFAAAVQSTNTSLSKDTSQ